MLGACRSECPPPEVRGGADEERRIAQDEVVAFYDLLREPICVPAVRVRPLRKDAWGKFNSGTRRVTVVPDLDERKLRETVRHELCHAVDLAHRISDPEDPLWSLDASFDGMAHDRLSARRRANESFALLCARGAAAIYLVGDACPDDTEGAEAYAAVRDLFDPPPGLDRSWSFLPVNALEARAERFVVTPTVDDTLRLELWEGDARTVAYLDPWTAAPAPLALPAQRVPVRRDDPLAPYAAVRGTSDGTDAVATIETVAPNGGRARRLVHRGPDGLGRIGCLRPEETPFLLDGEVWSAYRDDEQIVWGVWAPG